MTGLKKIGLNSAWMLIGYAFRTLSAFITSVLVARYLGPEGFGEMNYVFSFVILFSVFSGVGINQFLRREFVAHPEKGGVYLGTALVLRFLGSLIALALIFSCGELASGNEQTRWLIAIYSISLIFTITDLSQVLLEAHLQSKYVTLSVIIQMSIFLVLKILFIYLKAPLVAFVALQTVEILLKSIVQFICISILKICPALRWSTDVAKYLLMESWPFFLAGSAVMVYQRVDLVMLGKMDSGPGVGHYAVAARISDLVSFLPYIISRSVFPALTKAKHRSAAEFNESMMKFSAVMFWGMTVVALLITLLVKWPFILFFGSEYAPAVSVISILAWKNVFMALGIVCGEWILLAGLHRYAPIRSGVALVVNIVLNLFLIPVWGADGAAFASLLAAFVNCVVMLAIIPCYRECLRVMVAGIFLGPMKFRKQQFTGAPDE